MKVSGLFVWVVGSVLLFSLVYGIMYFALNIMFGFMDNMGGGDVCEDCVCPTPSSSTLPEMVCPPERQCLSCRVCEECVYPTIPDCSPCLPHLSDGDATALKELRSGNVGGFVFNGGYGSCKKDVLCLLGLRKGCVGGGVVVRPFNYNETDSDFDESNYCFNIDDGAIHINPDYWIIEDFGRGIKLSPKNRSMGGLNN